MDRCRSCAGLLLALALPSAAFAAAGAAASADTAAAWPDSAVAWPDSAVAWPDSVPTLEGVDWSLVTGAMADSLLLSGMGVVLAFEDTFAFDPGTVDTMLVTAPRVTIGEVIEAIGRRMEQESRRLQEAEFTTLTTVVERDLPSRRGDDYTVTETAERHRVSRDSGEQTVRLWKRERKVKDGVVVEEEIDEKAKTSWQDLERSMMTAMPFSPGSGGRYRYTITGRELVGNDLIYRIGFTPKNRFEALPTGTVWVDYSHWVIRKVEARMTEVVPFPLFVEAVPVFRMSRERFGEYWFTTDMHLEVDLKQVPLVGNPRVIEVRVQLQDMVINGQPRRPDSGVPRLLRRGNLDPDQSWLSEEASDDSLRVYWDRIAKVWGSEMSPALAPVELSPARVDSLTVLGSRVLAEMQQASPWTAHVRRLMVPGYNRVQGPVLRLGATVRHRGPVRPRLDLAAGYGFSNGRPEFRADLRLPLVRGHATRVPGDPRPRRGVLELRAAGWKEARQFAGDGRRHARAASALFYGSDPNQYFESRGADARLVLNAGSGLDLWGRAGYAQERALDQTATWNALGRQLRPDGNWAAQRLDDDLAGAGLDWAAGSLAVAGSVTWHRADGPDFAAMGQETVERRELAGAATLDLIDGLGNQWVLKGAARSFDGQAPRQWQAWLGDYGTLRGYPAAELGGAGAAWGSLDLRLGLDLARSLRLPVLEDWGLQPLGFVDWGRAWHESGPWPQEGAAGERWDVGFGLGTRVQLPFAWQFPFVRCYAAKPVGEGSEGRGWRVLVAFEK
ncbi:MAG: hypothetical protein R6X35_12905 [Candidatus Krumholzibacteriia bacterium]